MCSIFQSYLVLSCSIYKGYLVLSHVYLSQSADSVQIYLMCFTFFSWRKAGVKKYKHSWARTFQASIFITSTDMLWNKASYIVMFRSNKKEWVIHPFLKFTPDQVNIIYNLNICWTSRYSYTILHYGLPYLLQKKNNIPIQWKDLSVTI